jgi:hypothetical protein
VIESTGADRSSAREPAGAGGELRLSLPEVKQLWWFLDGAIMAPDVRAHVRRSWGFCPRHSWAFAAAEIQLRGGQPFATAILYEDLTRRAVDAVDASWRRLSGWRRASPLAPQDSCFTCDYLALEGEEDRTFRDQQDRTNQLDRVRPLLEETRREWYGLSCPLCLGGAGLVCRQHLLEGTKRPADLSDGLSALADRLQAFVGSMTTRATPVGPLERASWVEALGWFSGWDYPARVSNGSPNQ